MFIKCNMSKFLSYFIFFFFLFFNLNLLADTSDDISKIIDLKETGLLTDQEYKNLLEKIIIQTEEYKKIKSLFDSEVINFEDFENFKNKIIVKYTIVAKYDTAKEANFFDNKDKY